MIKEKGVFNKPIRKQSLDECAYKPNKMKEEYYLSLLPLLESEGKEKCSNTNREEKKKEYERKAKKYYRGKREKKRTPYERPEK